MSDNALGKFLAEHGVTSTVVEDDSELAHYGVKGMKWGVRKDRVSKSAAKKTAAIVDISKSGGESDGVAVASFSKKQSPNIGKADAAMAAEVKEKIFTEFVKEPALNNLYSEYKDRMSNDPTKRSKLQGEYDKKYAKLLSDFVKKNTLDGYASNVLMYHDRPDMYLVIGGKTAVKKLTKEMPGLRVKHSDDLDSFEVLRIKPTRDKDGLITSLEIEEGLEEDLEHSDDLDDFLMHYGVKGMKWGVRRSPEELDRLAGRDGGSAGTKKRAKGLKGAVQAARERKERKARETLEKAARRTVSTTPELSADAERFVKTSMKAGASMSDQEIKKYLERARLVKEYEQLTSKPTKSQAELLKEQYEIMNYTKKMADLRREMTPKKASKVDKFVNRAGQAYAAYKVIDKVTGGELSKKIGGDLMDVINGTGKQTQTNRPAPNRNKPKGGKRKKSNNTVYNITSLGH